MPAAESDENNIPHWIMAYDTLSWSKPNLPSPYGDETPSAEVVNYYQYLQDNYPIKEGSPSYGKNKAI